MATCGNNSHVLSRTVPKFDINGPVLLLLLRTVFENIKNTILMFFKNCFCYLNLLFSIFFVFFRKKNKKKKLGTKGFLIFIVLLVFYNKKQFSKSVIKYVHRFFFLHLFTLHITLLYYVPNLIMVLSYTHHLNQASEIK